MYWLYTWQIIRFDDPHFFVSAAFVTFRRRLWDEGEPDTCVKHESLLKSNALTHGCTLQVMKHEVIRKTKPSFILWTEDATVIDASTTKGMIISFPVVPGQHISHMVPQDQTGVWFSRGCHMSDEATGKDVQCGLYQAHMELNKQEIS